MEYYEMGDLQRYLTRPLPEPEARRITFQVLEGLEFMHDNGFVHRDIKPGVRYPSAHGHRKGVCYSSLVGLMIH